MEGGPVSKSGSRLSSTHTRLNSLQQFQKMRVANSQAEIRFRHDLDLPRRDSHVNSGCWSPRNDVLAHSKNTYTDTTVTLIRC
eukprot:3794540-Pyramimonas_sp.AAC.1